jgi:hypothetical protein
MDIIDCFYNYIYNFIKKLKIIYWNCLIQSLISFHVTKRNKILINIYIHYGEYIVKIIIGSFDTWFDKDKTFLILFLR